MPNLDFWVQEPFIFIVGEDADTLIRYRIPDLTPIESDEPLPPAPHGLNGPMWLLPRLPDGYSETLDASYIQTVRYQTIAHPGRWKRPSRDPCITAINLHAHDIPGVDVDFGNGLDGEGGFYFIETRPDEDGDVLDLRILPKPRPQSNVQDVPLPASAEAPSWEAEFDSERSDDSRARTQLNLYPQSRIHLLGPSSKVLLISLKNEALIDQRTQSILLQLKAYALSAEGYLEQWPIEQSIWTDIPFIEEGRQTGSKGKKIKTTSAPCSISGTFLASKKHWPSPSTETGAQGTGPPGTGRRHVCTVWLMRFT